MEIRWIHTFSKGINPKVRVIAQLEFELAHFEATVQHFSYYALKTSLKTLGLYYF